mgnify:CR=1 FL=1
MLPRFKETWRTSTISIGSSLKSKSKRASSISLFANAGIATGRAAWHDHRRVV